MAKGLNKVILIGHLGQDPDIRYTANGDAVANVSLATTEQWTDNAGQKQQKTEWHRLTAWRRLAEIMQQYLHKGDLIYVEGKLQTNKWTDKDGVERYTTNVVVNQMLMLSTQRSDQGQNAPPPHYQGDPGPIDPRERSHNELDDDIPF